MKRSLKSLVLSSIMVTGFVFTGLNPVNAEEVTNNFNLDEYVVTATRSENKIVDTPANISLITKDDFEKKELSKC